MFFTMRYLKVAVIVVFFSCVFCVNEDKNYTLANEITKVCFTCLRTNFLKNNSSCEEKCCSNCNKSREGTELLASNTRNVTYNQIGIPRPILYCAETSKLELAWNATKSTLYYLEYSRMGNTQTTNPTIFGHEILENLSCGASYSIILRSITILSNDRVQLGNSIPFTYRTRTPGVPPRPVTTFNLVSWKLEENDTYTALVKWEKGPDMACYYNIYSFGGPEEDYEMFEIVDPLAPEALNIYSLSFGRNYHLFIMPYTEYHDIRIEGQKQWVNITVPTCLESHQSLQRCTPEQPQNLTVAEIFITNGRDDMYPTYNINICWNEPRYKPDFYNAILLIFAENATEHRINVTGESTSTSFDNIKIAYEYEILLVAFSRRGQSDAARVHKYVNESFIISLKDDESFDSVKFILIAICPLVLLCIILIYGLNHYLSRKVKNEQRNNYFKELGQKSPPSVIKTASTITNLSNEMPDKWEIDVNDLMIKTLLGEGAFGVVRKGWYTNKDDDKVEIAIKMLRDNPTQEELQQFYQEIEIMKSVPPHPHLVSLIGCVTRGNLLLVTKYCSKGDLQSYLRAAWEKLSNANLTISEQEPETIKTPEYFSNLLYDLTQSDMENIPQPKDLISFARQIVLGMEYLASMKLIHRDLAARNVLVCEDNTVKISDFGLSRDVYFDNVYCKVTGGKLPIRWMALESMTHQMYTSQSDVWSFGVLLWEIVTMGSTPYPGVSTQDLLPMLKSGYRMEKPTNCSDELYTIMCSCWKVSPKERPSFTDLRLSFDHLLGDISCYLNLNINDCTDTITHKKTVDASNN